MSDLTRKTPRELFTVEDDRGEMVDVTGDGGYSVFQERAEAEDCRDSEESATNHEFVYRVVRYVETL